MKNVTANELNEKQNNGEKILVDFYADWCQPCKMLTPNLESIENNHELISFVKYNVDERSPILEDLRIRAVPTVILFDGINEVSRFSGVRSSNDVNNLILESFK